MKSTKIEEGDIVQLSTLPNWTYAEDRFPLCTEKAYKHVTGQVQRLVDSGKTSLVFWDSWPTSTVGVNLKHLTLVGKYKKVESEHEKVLKRYSLAASYSKHTLFIDSKSKGVSKLSKRLMIKEKKFPQVNSNSCYQKFFAWSKDFLQRNKKQPNRVLLDQTKEVTGKRFKGKSVLTYRELKVYFKKCKENGMLPSYVPWRLFKKRQMYIDLTSVANSITFYTYVCTLRSVRECPGAIKCMVYLHEKLGLSWIDAYILGNCIGREDGYYSLFNLATKEINKFTPWDEAKVDVGRLKIVKHFLRNDLRNWKLTDYKVLNEDNEMYRGFSTCYYLTEKKYEGSDMAIKDYIKTLKIEEK